MVGDADDVAGPGLLGEVALAGEKNTGACTDMTRPVRTFFNVMPRWKRPEAIRTKAMRSRCCGSILAYTLKTKPAILGSSGEIGRRPLIPWAGCGRGAGASSPTPGK